ncbi:YjgN family protein [Lysobacter cavernae]|uniref:YjgN family protein n=1 Tax=Lysobacter cavernae TaxID=1685901 RepID=A0ABV7RMJ1_9GAMM
MLDRIPPTWSADDFHAPAPVESTQVVRHGPQFSGRAGEYFGIWFVNLLLSIVTLGIYSAWAKVRTERYFYANTRLADSSFDYLANPLAILKGRLIAYAVVIALVVSSKFSPGLYLLLILAIALMVPALLVLTLRFRARNSAWRGLSFRFDGGIGEAYGPFLLWGWLSGMTLSLLYPVMKKRQHEFLVESHRYGVKRFSYRGQTGAYYVPYAIAVGVVVAGLIAVVMLAGSAVATGGSGAKAAAGMGFAFGIAAFYLGFFAVMIFLQVRYHNLLWNSARLGPHRFESTQRVRDLLWIYFCNLVAIVCTLGLAVPWAMVRLARYRAEHFTLLAAGNIEEFVAASESRHAAAGAELVDALDVGMDLGF